MSDLRGFHVSQDGQVSSLATAPAALAARAAGGYVWIDVVNPTRDDLDALAEPFGLHPLAIEDCLDDQQVPKIEEFPGSTFVLFNRHHFSDRTLRIEEVDFFIGQGFLVTVSAHSEAKVGRARLDEAIRLDRAGVGKGPDFLLHVILDHIVDRKLLALEALQDDLDTAGEDTLRRGSAAFDPSGLLDLRRSLLAIRKSLFHEREILTKICRRDSPFISEASIFRFRDIYDHLVKFVEIVEICRELISSLLEIHLSLVNNELARLGNRTNQVVRRLTYITTIFMPLSFFAGIGGMSEWSMMTGPQNWRIAYPAFLAGMAVIGVISYFILTWLDGRGTGHEAWGRPGRSSFVCCAGFVADDAMSRKLISHKQTPDHPRME